MRISLSFMFLMSLCLLVMGCNTSDTDKYDSVIALPDTNAGPVISFDGLSSVTNKTDSTLTLNWKPNQNAFSYGIFVVKDGASVLLKTLNEPASSSINLAGLTPSQSYTFRVRLKTSSGIYDPNTNDMSVRMNDTPDSPSLVELVNSNNPDTIFTPTIKVSGVKKGDTIKIFKDLLCTQLMGSALAEESSVQIISSPLDFGSHNIYASATNQLGNVSGCSTANLPYVINPLSFAGIKSITSLTDSTAQLNWEPHPEAVSYDVYKIDSGLSEFLVNVPGQASESVMLSKLIPDTTYTFRVRVKTANGINDTNQNDMVIKLNSSPDIPNNVTLFSPTTTPNNIPTPQIQVSGVKSGDTVKVFTDNSCVTKVGEGMALGDTVVITTSALSFGVHSLYANSSNSLGNSSGCSSSYASYELMSCPENYIRVARNSSLGVPNDFCVAKFEMKNVGGKAVSQSAQVPWTTINANASRSACLAIGNGYDLISNPEWMTIAYSIEATAINWSGPSVGIGSIYRGHSDSFPIGPVPVTDINNPYTDTNNSASQNMGGGREQRRTLVLANGDVIWDFSGNVSEWVNWSLGSNLTLGPRSCSASWTQIPVVSCAALQAADYMPGNPAGISSTSYNSTFGLGQIYGGGGGVGLRGGRWSDGINSGIFSLSLIYGTLNASSGMGFRCVYRP